MHADITFKRQNTKDIKGQWCVQFICEYSPQACRLHTLSYGLSPHEKDLSQLLQLIHFGDSQFCLHVGISCFLQLNIVPCNLPSCGTWIYLDLDSGVRFDITCHFVTIPQMHRRTHGNADLNTVHLSTSIIYWNMVKRISQNGSWVVKESIKMSFLQLLPCLFFHKVCSNYSILPT